MNRPYVPPSSDFGGEGFSGRVSPRVVSIMSRTKGWVRFIAVMMFLNFGITIINTFVTIGSQQGVVGDARRAGQIFGAVLVMLLYLYPAVKLNSYASRIGVLLQSGQSGDLEIALNEHRAFWRYVGIVALVFMSIFVIALFVGIVAGVAKSRF